MAQPQAPANTTKTKVKDPIGVPGGVYQNPDGSFYYSGYTAQVPGQTIPLGYADPFNRTAGSTGTSYTPTLPTPPKYFDGDQWSPANLGIDDMISLQQGLTAAGLYTGDYTLGVWGTNDVAAYERLLSMANAAGADDKTMLARAVAGAQANPKKKNPLVVKLTSDDDLKSIIQDSSNAIFGKYLHPEDVQKFIDTYHQQQTNYQTASYAATGYNPDTGQGDTSGLHTGGGTTLTAPPTSAGGINRQLETQMFQDHPAEAGESVFSSKLNLILQGLHSGGTGQ